MADPEALGRYAGERALARLRARKIGTRQAPVLVEAPLASGLSGHFVSAVSGGSLYRKATFLLDCMGKPVFSPPVVLTAGHARGEAIRAARHGQLALVTTFDEESVATLQRSIVNAGVVEGYFLGTYSARKLGLQTTGSAGGNQNLVVKPGTDVGAHRQTRPLSHHARLFQQAQGNR